MPESTYTTTAAVHAEALDRVLREPADRAQVIAAAAFRPIPDHRRRLTPGAILDHALIDARNEARSEADHA